MKVKYLLAFFFLLIHFSSIGQIGFQKAIGGPNQDQPTSIIKTSDGGYALAGGTSSYGAGGTDIYIIKLDSNFNIQWTRTLGGTNEDFAEDIIQTFDGGYAVAGATVSYSQGSYDGYIAKIDSVGNLQWTRSIGGPGIEILYSIVQTSNGNIAVTGATYSFGQGYGDVYVVRLDSNGNVLWTRTIGGPGNNDLGSSIITTIDNGLVIAGRTGSFASSSYYDMYIIKLDSIGDLIWTRSIGGSQGNEEAYDLIQTKDNGFAITGVTMSFGAGLNDVYVVKLDSAGSLIWTKTVGGPSQEKGYSIIQAKDEGYAITGEAKNATEYDAYVIKLTSSGNLEWDTKIGGMSDDLGFAIQQLSDGAYVIAGWTQSFGSGSIDGYILKLDGNGTSCNNITGPGIEGSGGLITSGGIVDSGGVSGSGGILGLGGGSVITVCILTDVKEQSSPKNSIRIIPNPVTGQSEISFLIHGKKIDELKIINYLGQIIYKESLNSSDNVFRINSTDFKEGLYTVLANCNGEIYATKFIVKRN